MKKIIVLFVLIMFILTFGCINNNEKIIEELNEKNNQKDSIIADLTNNINQKDSNINNYLNENSSLISIIYEKDVNITNSLNQISNLNTINNERINTINILNSDLSSKTNELNNKDIEIVNLTNNLSVKNNEIIILNNTLSSKLNELNIKNNEIANIVNDLDYKNSELVNKANEINNLNNIIIQKDNNFLQLENEVRDSIDFINTSQSWFEFNNKVDNSSFIDELYNECVNDVDFSDKIFQNNYDFIDLECIGQFNKDNGFNYIDDSISSNIGDKLQSIDEFMNYKNGDCEDYSLFFKAEYNSLKEKTTKPIKNIIGEDEINYYYIDNNIMVIICGFTETSGHCEVALIENNINDLKDVRNLLNGRVFEPQDGTYRNIITDSFLFYGPDGWYDLEEIITENNYIKKYNDKWYDYNTSKYFLKEVIK